MIKFAKFLLRGLLRLLYRVEVEGLQHYHEAGDRVLIVANHTSLLDGALLYAWLPETPTFAINSHIFEKKIFKPFLRFVDLFIMDPTNPLSVKSMIKFIKQDRKAVIFPEGRITTTGSLMKIYDGPAMIADKAKATILPIAIDGAVYTPFSYMRGRGRIVWFPKIRLTVLPPYEFRIDPDIHGHARREAAALKLQDIMYDLTYHSYDCNKTLFSAFLEAIKRYGKQQVIVEDINRQPLTYKQLLLKVMVLAQLMESDTENNEHVAILLPNVIATPVTFLALQFLGCVPAMLNFTGGIQNMIRACETGRIKTIYSSRKFVENAKLEEVVEALEKQFQVIFLEDLREKLTLSHKLKGLIYRFRPNYYYQRMSGRPGPDQPAVILFTSGSEGLPKGVVLSHRNILANFAQVNCHIDFRPSDILFSCLPTFHTFGLDVGTIMPLLAGTKVFLYPTPLHYRIIPELVYELQATILFGTNTFFKGYARYAHPYDFNSMRYVVAGAEKLHDDTLRMWMEKFGIRICQGYGVTETSPVISVNTKILHKIGTVGRPMPGMQCAIQKVDGIEQGGRLIVKGANVMLGYLLHGNKGEFHFPECDMGEGWYDTGDIATIDEDNYITILGRAKRFAKIGGEMISLTAVEELAMQVWPNYNHAAISLPDERKGEKIILITDYSNGNRKEIQEYVRQHKYGELFIPRQVLLTEDFPVLGTGKIDYITLTELARSAEESGTGWLNKLTNLVKKNEHKTLHSESNTGDNGENDTSEDMTLRKDQPN